MRYRQSANAILYNINMEIEGRKIEDPERSVEKRISEQAQSNIDVKPSIQQPTLLILLKKPGC